MVDINKQIDHWKNGSVDDWESAQVLLKGGKSKQALFFLHLSFEKMLKAHVCHQKKELAPKLHNLIRLAEMAGVDLTEERKLFLGRINLFNLEGRYPEEVSALPDSEKVLEYFSKSKEVMKWLQSQ